MVHRQTFFEAFRHERFALGSELPHLRADERGFALLGNNGGVPVAADEADITDEKSAELIANFNTLAERDGIAFYPDWPTPTFYDELNAGLQELVNGTKSPAEVQDQLGEQYQSGVDDIVG